MDDRTMYMCTEIIALVNPFRVKTVHPPPPPPPKKKKKKKKNNDTPAPSLVKDTFWIA